MLNSKKNTSGTTENTSTAKVKNNDKGILSAIMGVAVAMVVVSASYASAVIALGTEGKVPLVMISPLAGATVGVIIYAFTKIFK